MINTCFLTLITNIIYNVLSRLYFLSIFCRFVYNNVHYESRRPLIQKFFPYYFKFKVLEFIIHYFENTKFFETKLYENTELYMVLILCKSTLIFANKIKENFDYFLLPFSEILSIISLYSKIKMD